MVAIVMTYAKRRTKEAVIVKRENLAYAVFKTARSFAHSLFITKRTAHVCIKEGIQLKMLCVTV